MKTAYLECFSGISGDMFLGALLHAGLDEDALRKMLHGVGVDREELVVEPVVKKGVSAMSVKVVPAKERHHLHVADIRKMLAHDTLPEKVRSQALHAFDLIISAESRIHNMPEDKVHLHEVSGLDTVVDLLGVMFGLHHMGIEDVHSTPVTVGSGTVTISHGTVPVPAPATMHILKGIPILSAGLPGERVTPTGAALLKTVVKSYGDLPHMCVSAIGYGAGDRQDGDRPNVLRLLTGETGKKNASSPGTYIETLQLLETNIDDQSPEEVGYLHDKLSVMEGVLDAHIVACRMKKNRPGFLVRVLCRRDVTDQVHALIFSESTTLGIRRWSVERTAKIRTQLTVKTIYGDIRIKFAPGVIAPEHDDCRAAAQSHGVPLKDVMAAARAAYLEVRSA